MRGRALALVLGALALVPAGARGQEPPPPAALQGRAQEVADAWARHDFAEVVRGERVAVAVPGVRRASAAPAEQVAAVLSGYVRGAEELGVTVVTAQVLGDGAGYVELERRYRPAGAGEEIRDRILLSYRGGAGGWHLVELLIQRA